MKRFWLFAGDEYYPGGGMKDFILSSDHLEEIVSQIVWDVVPPKDATIVGSYSGIAFASVDSRLEGIDITLNFGADSYSWFHIFDSAENKVVEAYSSYGRGTDCFDNLGNEPTDTPRQFFENGKFHHR